MIGRYRKRTNNNNAGSSSCLGNALVCCHRARSNQRVLARQAKRNRCVKKILGHRIHAGCLQYQVVWSGNNDRKPHYVPQACLLSAQALVTDYWQRFESGQSQQHVPKRRRLEKEFAEAE